MIVRIRRLSRGARFIHPSDPTSRTAILAPGFRPTRLVRVFPEGWNKRAKRFDPGSIAGPPEQLRMLARDGWPMEQAVIVFTYASAPGISSPDRETFWRAFGVPVFEQYLSPANKLLATECDAHEGLHVVSGCEGFPLEYDICPCGNPAPRVTRGSRIEELAGLLA
ncbi:MAG TPA: hypothetical protein VK686_18500 [Bryobacteraceae bacterium]|nr:hypothetical protein [Bryobacteraceae bacterium]